jgi:hypothetical protein
MRTETLIHILTADAARPVIGLRPRIWAALAAGASGSAALFVLLLGPRPDLVAKLTDYDFLVKITVTGCLALTAALALDTVARPMRRRRKLPSLALAPLLLACAVLVKLVTAPASTWFDLLVSRNAWVCMSAIPVLSALPAAFLLMALRRGAPANPRLAGAVAGLAAGGLGASLYAIFCPVDNALFVAGWYSLAIGAVTMACARLGQRWLRW